jgi:hypothetical protein
VDVVTYRRCRYDGGFAGMKSSSKARLIVSTDRLTLRRPRVLLGSRKTNIMKIWARWSAVIDLDIRAVKDGTRVVFTTRSRGTARVTVPGVEPLDVWRALDQVDDLRGRIPPRVRKALDGEGSLDEQPVDDVQPGDELGQPDEVDLADGIPAEGAEEDDGESEDDDADDGEFDDDDADDDDDVDPGAVAAADDVDGQDGARGDGARTDLAGEPAPGDSGRTPD